MEWGGQDFRRCTKNFSIRLPENIKIDILSKTRKCRKRARPASDALQHIKRCFLLMKGANEEN